MNELYEYLARINHENLSNIKLESMAFTRVFDERYFEAVEIINVLFRNPMSIYDELSLEITQAFSYMRAVETGTEKIPQNSRWKPSNIDEYLKIREEILNKINELNEKEPEIGALEPDSFKFTTGNYPNPFNPQTNISFTLPNDANVSIVIFNVKGQRVRTLKNEDMKSGQHSVVWNGTNDSGQSVGSGVYFYKLQAGEHSATKRMLLMK